MLTRTGATAQPIVSLSLGCSAVLLVGGTDRDAPPSPLLVRHGDAVIFTGALPPDVILSLTPPPPPPPLPKSWDYHFPPFSPAVGLVAVQTGDAQCRRAGVPCREVVQWIIDGSAVEVPRSKQRPLPLQAPGACWPDSLCSHLGRCNSRSVLCLRRSPGGLPRSAARLR